MQKCIHLAEKLVFVALVFLGLVFPTFNFGLTKSLAFSFFFLADEPMIVTSVCSLADLESECVWEDEEVLQMIDVRS